MRGTIDIIHGTRSVYIYGGTNCCSLSHFHNHVRFIAVIHVLQQFFSSALFRNFIHLQYMCIHNIYSNQ